MHQEIVIALRRIIRAVDRHSGTLAKRFGLTGPQLLVLTELASNDSITTGALAKKVHMAQGTVSEILERLEKTGYVERHRDDRDRRKVECRVTPKTAEVLEHTPSLLPDRFAQELTKLEDWERSFLLTALQRIANIMDAEDLDAAPVLASGPVVATVEETVDFHSEAAK
jgi:DNA-binding MarR family transcriptional regulator